MSLFKDLSGSLARFIVAWLVPSVAAVAVFVVLVLPDLREVLPGGVLEEGAPLQAAVQFSIAVLVLSVLFAYVSLPIYQFLEGYTMPPRLARRLRRRQLREWYRLRAQFEHELRTDQAWQFTLERLAAYPESEEHVMPTRLGNALLAMEEYGGKRFGLDSQTLWYELLSTSPEGLRRDAEDARAGVDVFISALVHLALLGTTAAVIAILTGGAGSIVVAVVALGLLPLSYRQAVRNVGEWRLTIRALVNLGRLPLAKALGVRLPSTFEEERELWETYSGLVAHGPHSSYLKILNRHRTTA